MVRVARDHAWRFGSQYPERPDAWASYRLQRLRRPFRWFKSEYRHVVEMHDWARMLRDGWFTFTASVNEGLYDFADDGTASLREEPDLAALAVCNINHECLHLAICQLAFRVIGERGATREWRQLFLEAQGGLDRLCLSRGAEDELGVPV